MAGWFSRLFKKEPEAPIDPAYEAAVRKAFIEAVAHAQLMDYVLKKVAIDAGAPNYEWPVNNWNQLVQFTRVRLIDNEGGDFHFDDAVIEKLVGKMRGELPGSPDLQQQVYERYKSQVAELKKAQAEKKGTEEDTD